jgi:c-di-GMP-related signal transduction protein
MLFIRIRINTIVERLLKAIKCQNAELLAEKAVINQQYTQDYVGAFGYFKAFFFKPSCLDSQSSSAGVSKHTE